MSNKHLMKIGDIAQVFDGPHATPKKIEQGPYFLSISSLESGKLDLSKSAHLSEEQFVKWTKRVTPQEGDVLFSYETRLGEAALMPRGVKACLGRRMGLLRPDREKVLPEYLLYAYLGPEFQQEIKTRTIHGATVDRIALKELPDFNIRIPEIEEQKKVVEILSTIDNKIQLNRQINQTLEQMAQALFKSWFVDFDPVIDNALDAGNPIPEELEAKVAQRKQLREAVAKGETEAPALPDTIRSLFPSQFEFTEEMGWIPKGWGASPFGELLSSSIGGDWGKDAQDEKHTVSAVIIRGTDIPNLLNGGRSGAPERWVEPRKLKTRALQDSDIVIEVSGGSPKQPTGRSILLTHNILDRLGGVVEPASFCRRLVPKSEELGLISALHLKKIYDEGKTWEYQNQSTGISNFQTKTFLAIEHVIVPDNQVLTEFYQRVRPLIDKVTANDQVHLEKLRDTLLPKLISGALQIPEAEQQVADALN